MCGNEEAKKIENGYTREEVSCIICGVKDEDFLFHAPERIVRCRRCGLIANQLFDNSIIGFKPGYEVALKHSRTFCEYIEGVCQRLVPRYDLHGKRILEIGCGAGDFLRLICAAGANHGVGIDPTLPRASTEAAGAGTVRFISDYYSKSH